MGHDDPTAHGHGHSHGHPHADATEHAHGPASGRGKLPRRADLPRAAGVGKTLFLDAPSGLSGDMIIAALVDLGVPETVIAEAVAGLPIAGFHLHFGTRVRSGVVAGAFEVHVDDAQPERTYGAIRQLLDLAPLDEKVRGLAHATFKRLAQAEATVHRTGLDEVHFHEVGAIDALADVVGSAAALAWIRAELVVSPLPMGRGFVRARHGVLPLPPPAVVECLAGFPTYDGLLDFEFVTPTGAAIVAAHAVGHARWPAMAPERVGWGAGSADLVDRPNLLRAVLGAKALAQPAEPAAQASPTHVVLEANLDDATGELVGGAIDALLAAGALDAWATPATMKKGRPALVVSAIAAAPRADAVAHAMLRETTSLGVRSYDVRRLERPRRMTTVDTQYGAIPVKVAEGPYGPPLMKPEFDACAAAARAHGVPVRDVILAALLAARAT